MRAELSTLERATPKTSPVTVLYYHFRHRLYARTGHELHNLKKSGHLASPLTITTTSVRFRIKLGYDGRCDYLLSVLSLDESQNAQYSNSTGRSGRFHYRVVFSPIQVQRFGVQLGFVRRFAHHRGVVLESRATSNTGRNLVQNWHWGLIVAIVIAYLVGVKFPATGSVRVLRGWDVTVLDNDVIIFGVIGGSD